MVIQTLLLSIRKHADFSQTRQRCLIRHRWYNSDYEALLEVAISPEAMQMSSKRIITKPDVKQYRHSFRDPISDDRYSAIGVVCIDLTMSCEAVQIILKDERIMVNRH